MADLSNKVISSNFQKLLQISSSNVVADATGSVTALSLDKPNSRVGIGTTSPTKTLSVVGTMNVSGSELFATSGSQANEIVSIISSGSILPATPVGNNTGSYDLGSATHPWRDLYVYEGSIKFVGGDGNQAIGLSFADVKDLREGKSISRRLDGTSKPGYVDCAILRGLTGGSTVDSDTYISMTAADRMQMVVGGVEILDFQQNAIPSTFTIGNDSTSYPLTIQPITSMSRDLHLTASADIFGNLLVRGDAEIRGNLTFGNSTTDSISFGAEVSSSIIPDASGSYDLGTAAKSWNRLNVNEITASGNISSSGTIQSTGNISTNGSITGGSASLAYLAVSGDITSSGNISCSGKGIFNDHFEVNSTSQFGVNGNDYAHFKGSITGSRNFKLHGSGLTAGTASMNHVIVNGATQNKYGSALLVNGSVSASKYWGDGSALTGVTAGSTVWYNGGTYITSSKVVVFDKKIAASNGLLQVSSSIVPSGSANYSLGTSNFRWLNLEVERIGVGSAVDQFYLNHLKFADNKIYRSTNGSFSGTPNILFGENSRVAIATNWMYQGIDDKLFVDGNISSSKYLKGKNLTVAETTTTTTLNVGGNISASGGDTVLNNVQLTNITASGHISASGTIYSDDLIIADKVGIDGAGTTSGKSLTVAGEISASGNITSNGTGSFEHISTDKNITVTKIIASGNISGSNSSIIYGGRGSFSDRIIVDNFYQKTAGAGHIFNHNITASGDIKVSGDNINFNNIPTSSGAVNTGDLFRRTAKQLHDDGIITSGSSANAATGSWFVMIKK